MNIFPAKENVINARKKLGTRIPQKIKNIGEWTVGAYVIGKKKC